MKKTEYIARHGEAAYEKKLEQRRAYYKTHREEAKAYNKKWVEEHREEAIARVKKWKEEHPEEVIVHTQRNSREKNCKGGKLYKKKLEDQRTGIPGDKNKIRNKHAKEYKPYKDIIAPESQLHHEWIPKTAEYRGLALVEKDQHMHGYVDVIIILDGKITLLTEEEIRKEVL